MAFRNVTDPDVGWHIKTGEWMVHHHAVPHADIFSFTRAGTPWIAHEWLSELLIYARERIPWVQANLILTDHDHREQIRNWQENLKKHGVWVSEPVPMFPYPGTPLYQQIFGPPDDLAWERAHRHYTGTFREKGYSDIQEANPRALEDLECTY